MALKEADDVEREARRKSLHEPYRTLLGHFRHEIGHYYWDRLIDDANRQNDCRALFGDDREDYEEALKRHYHQGTAPNWQENFVSAYATCHPWEDFAETWAHYLHIVDSLETAQSFGLAVHPAITPDNHYHADATLDPYQKGSFRAFDRDLASSYLCHEEFDEPQHGPERHISLRAFSCRHPETVLHT